MTQVVNGVVTTYTLDLAAGLTQVLADGNFTYLYGNGRVAQATVTQTAYFLGDALGSVRHLVDSAGLVTLARSYEPYGDVLTSAGSGVTSYSFTGEWRDGSGLIYLRARYYASGVGRFTARDTWAGDYYAPQSLNAWAYGYSSPINYSDPSGHNPALCLLGLLVPVAGEFATGACLVAEVAAVVLVAYLSYNLIVNGQEIGDCIAALVPGKIGVRPDTGGSTTPTGESLDNTTEVWRASRSPAVPAPEPPSNPYPRPESTQLPIPWPMIPDNPSSKEVLFHYTNQSGYLNIMASQEIWADLKEGNRAAGGHGQYFTNISPAEASTTKSSYMSYALFETTRLRNRVMYYFAIDVTDLTITRYGPVYTRAVPAFSGKSLFVHLSERTLSVAGKILDSGPVTYQP